MEDLQELEADEALLETWTNSQIVVQAWWEMWSRRYWHTLVPQTKWSREHRAVRVRDICNLRYGGAKSRPSFRLCRIVKTLPDDDNITRTVEVAMRPRNTKYKGKSQYCVKEMKIIRTAVQGLAVLLPEELQEEWQADSAEGTGTVSRPGTTVEEDPLDSEDREDTSAEQSSSAVNKDKNTKSKKVRKNLRQDDEQIRPRRSCRPRAARKEH